MGAFYHRDSRRDYLQCGVCELVFVPPDWHLDPAAERAEYDLHRNYPRDEGYRRFLGRLAEPLCDRVAQPGRGLDFGCGPGPALDSMLREAGHEVALYDQFYQPDDAVFATGAYDFITATEVVEHLREPRFELARLWDCLRPGGYLGLMTKLVIDAEAFARWHYKNDPTHICFYTADTWRWWAGTVNAGLELIGSDVILLRKA
jgi:SAM-dependent methyltransferase